MRVDRPFFYLRIFINKKMTQVIISERQKKLIEKHLVNSEKFELAEKNWNNFSDEEKKSIFEICKSLYPKKNKLIKESSWYNTLGDIVGIFDPTGVVDLVNGISYIKQGDNLFGFLSIISAVPYIGDVVAKPVMGALKVGAPSVKALETVMKTAKTGNSVKAAEELAKISATGGIAAKFVSGFSRVGDALRNIIQKAPLPGGLKRTINQWIDLFSNASKTGKNVRYVGQYYAKKFPKLTREEQIKNMENLIKMSKSSGVFSSFKTSGGITKTIFGGMPQLIGRNRSVRALVRQTKFWAGFLDFLGLGNFVGPDEMIKDMGQDEFEKKLTEYQKTSEGENNFEESFGSQTREKQPSAETSKEPSTSQDLFGSMFSNIINSFKS